VRARYGVRWTFDCAFETRHAPPALFFRPIRQSRDTSLSATGTPRPRYTAVRCGEALERAGSGVTATACRGCGPRAALQERMKPPGHKFARALRLIFFPGWLRARGGYDVWRWISLPRGKQEIRCDLDGYRRIPVPVFQICRVIGHDWMRRSNTMSCVEEVSLRDHSA
jgi:hypothetical protein